GRRRARDREGARDGDVPRDQLAARPSRPDRRARTRRARGGPQARDRLRRSRAVGARLPGARRRPGPACVADGERRRQHAHLETGRAAEEEAPVIRAVVFDLWDTLVEFPVREADVLKSRLAELAAVDPEEFERRWRDGYRASQTGPLADSYRALGVPDEHVAEHVAARHAFTRTALRLRRGARETLAAFRARGIKLRLITVCSEDVPAIWPETELAGLFDAETFSSTCGLIKPDPEIYLTTLAALGGVEPRDALFVG